LLASGAMMRPDHHGNDEVALARRLGIEELVETQAPHGRQHRLDVAVRSRAHHIERTLERSQLLALQHAPDHLRLLDRQRRQVGDGALSDALALANAFAKQDGGRRASVWGRYRCTWARYA
jgi:hypothetical protein